MNLLENLPCTVWLLHIEVQREVWHKSSPHWPPVSVNKISQLYKYYTRHTTSCVPRKRHKQLREDASFEIKTLRLSWFWKLALNPLWLLIILQAGLQFYHGYKLDWGGVQLECKGRGYCTSPRVSKLWYKTLLLGFVLSYYSPPNLQQCLCNEELLQVIYWQID